MSEHYPRGQIEAEAWCPQCQRITLHRVAHPPAGQKGGGRLGPCIDPAHPPVPEFTKAQKKRREREAKERREPKLF